MKALILAMRQIGIWVLILSLWPISASAAKKVGDANPAPGFASVGNPFDMASLGQFALGLMVVIGVIFLLAWILRRMNRIQGRIQGHVKIIAGLSLGSRERVILLQVGKEQVLLGVSPGRVSRLLVLEQPLETEFDESKGKTDFRERLIAAMQGRRSQ